jgi:hypothetical protein
MIEQFFTQPKVLSRLQEGFFGPYLPAFAASLHEEGYSAGCIRRFLTSTGVVPVGLISAVPSVRSWQHSALPRAVSADDV